MFEDLTDEERTEIMRIECELFTSIDTDDTESLQRLIDSGIDPDATFNLIGDECDPLFSPLHFCCMKGHYQCARVLLGAGADKDAADTNGLTPLMYAIEAEKYDMVELMLDSGAGIDLQDERGRTPLHLALHCSDHRTVELLCKRNADVNVRDRAGRTPLWMAVAMDGRVGHLTELLKFQPDLDVTDLRDLRTALQVAIVYAKTDRLEYVRRLVDAGCSVNHRDENNHNSMLNLLAKLKRNDKRISDDELVLASKLLDAGYQLNERSQQPQWHKYRGTALQMAADQGADQMVKLFLEKGADPNITDDCGVTPLLAASMNNHLECCHALIFSKCKLEVVGDVRVEHIVRQVTPLKIAVINGHLAVAKLLVESIAGTPMPLFEKCMFFLRSILGEPLHEHLQNVPLPPYLRTCVLEYDFCKLCLK